MKNKKNILLNVLFFTFLILITYYIIFKDYSIKDILNTLNDLNYNYLLIAIAFMILYFLIEGLNIKLILNSFKEKISLAKSFIFSLICFFFSAITPGGSGGQPLAIYYLSKEKIKVSHSALAYLIQLLGYNVSALILGIVFAICFNKVFDKNSLVLFIIGSILMLIPISLTFIGIFSKKITKFLVNLVIKLLTKLKIKKIDKFKERINQELKIFQDSSSYIKTHKKEFIKSIVLSFLQVITIYVVPYFIYRSFGLNEYNIIFILGLQAILHNATVSLPLPGAVGITETVFLMLYSYIYPAHLIHGSLIISRFITFYLFVIIALITFCIYKGIKKTELN